MKSETNDTMCVNELYVSGQEELKSKFHKLDMNANSDNYESVMRRTKSELKQIQIPMSLITKEELRDFLDKEIPVWNKLLKVSSPKRLKRMPSQRKLQRISTPKRSCKRSSPIKRRSTTIIKVRNSQFKRGDKHECPVCLKPLASEKSMYSHINQVHQSEIRFPCDYCNKTFAQSWSAKVHVQEIHFGLKRYNCPHCPRGFRGRSKFEFHVRSHKIPETKLKSEAILPKGTPLFKNAESPPVNEAPQQSPRSAESSSLNETPQKLPKDSTSPPLNGYTYRAPKYLEILQKTVLFTLPEFPKSPSYSSPSSPSEPSPPSVSNHVSKKILPWTKTKIHSTDCLECGERFSCRNDLKRHTRKHIAILFVCQICKQTFRNKRRYQLHEKSHELSELLAYQSKVNTLNSSVQLTVHINYSCQYCDAQFKSKKVLNLHEEMHTSQSLFAQQYNCKVCRMEFSRTSALCVHERSHTKGCPSYNTERKFFHCRVPHCNKRFKDIGMFKLHERRHQASIASEKRFQCFTCWKDFPRRWMLELHDRKHKMNYAGIKPLPSINPEDLKHEIFKCQYCSQYIVSRTSLILHENWHILVNPQEISSFGAQRVWINALV